MVKTINSEKVYSGGIIDVYKDRIVLENGVETSRDVVRHRQAAAVVAVNDRDELVMVEQFRYPIGKKQRELPLIHLKEPALIWVSAGNSTLLLLYT